MNSLKKRFGIFLIFVSLFGFAACSEKDDDPRPQEDERINATLIEEGEPIVSKGGIIEAQTIPRDVY